jgi:hypothetical protein
MKALNATIVHFPSKRCNGKKLIAGFAKRKKSVGIIIHNMILKRTTIHFNGMFHLKWMLYNG